MTMRRPVLAVLAAGAFQLTSAAFSVARADIITFTFSGQISGTLAGSPFTNVPYSVSITGNTANVISGICTGSPPAGIIVVSLCNLSGSITLSGFGTNSFVLPLYVFDNQSNGGIGFGDGAHFDLIDVFSVPGGTSYGLTSNFGPVTSQGGALGTQFTNVATSGGNLTLTGSGSTTFSAVVTGTAVPEPATATLVAIGLFGFTGVLLRRRRTL